MDYNWDLGLCEIEKDIPCLCASDQCRKFLMLAEKIDRTKEQRENFTAAHWELIERERREI